MCISIFKVLGGASGEDSTQSSRPFFMHIGSLIKEELYRQGKSPTWLASQINCDRTNVYYIFGLESINTALLERISRALNYDFFQRYSAEMNSEDEMSIDGETDDHGG